MRVCYIPSKGRPQTTTHKLFEDTGFEVYHVVEPQEQHLYKQKNIIVMDKNDQGIAYARNYILDHARQKQYPTVIVCDDDVRHFGQYYPNTKKNKMFTNAAPALTLLEALQKSQYTMAGINYRQYAWQSSKPHSINTKFVEVCIAIKPMQLPHKYLSQLDTKEDRDYCLQAIKHTKGIFRLNYLFFENGTVGELKGGLQEQYKQGKDKATAQLLAHKYKPYSKMVNRKGRIDCQIDIRQYAKDLNKITI